MFNEIAAKVPQLNHLEKLKLIQLLVLELASEDEKLMLIPNAQYEVWTPLEAYEAADTLQKMLDEHRLS